MKALVSSVMVVVGLLITVPMLLAGGDNPDSGSCSGELIAAPGADIPVEIEAILATIRQRESGDDYQARARGSTASGAYQFIDTTWARYGGYPEAAAAPPDIQDTKAAEHVTGILDAHGGELIAVPAVWYIGHRPPDDDPTWDRVPAPGAGNVLTPRQYVDDWLNTYQQQLNQPGLSALDEPAGGQPDASPDGQDQTTTDEGSTSDGDQAKSQAVCAPNENDSGGVIRAGGWAYPGPADLFANALVNDPHHDYPAWDWALPEGTPIYAIRGGTVTWAETSRHANRCGIGLTITDDTDTQWTYCHASQLHSHTGADVEPGTHIMDAGNTGNSTGPHLHLGIRTPDGTARCPQPLIAALQADAPVPDPRILPSGGCTY